MNFRSWQRWQLIEYALLQKISEEKAVENGKALPQTKSEVYDQKFIPNLPRFHCMFFLTLLMDY